MSKNQDRSISVGSLFQDNEKSLRLTLISGEEGLSNRVMEKDIHRPGLALAGFVDLFTYQQVQICGNTEMLYLQKLTPEQRSRTLKSVFSFKIPCILVTNKNSIFPELAQEADFHKVPLFTTPFATTKATQLLGNYLDEQFAPKTHLHGSLVDVYGIGIFITGRSGIGKSEVALDLVARGHRLVADDVVTITRHTGGILIGRGNETLRYNMEIRGVGIIDVQAVFGIRGVRRQKRIEVQVELADWDNTQKYERLGLKDLTVEILGEKIPLIRLPIYPGKNISVIVETIALNQLLKIYGHHSAKQLEARLTRKMTAKLRAMKNYLDHDFE